MCEIAIATGHAIRSYRAPNDNGAIIAISYRGLGHAPASVTFLHFFASVANLVGLDHFRGGLTRDAGIIIPSSIFTIARSPLTALTNTTEART